MKKPRFIVAGIPRCGTTMAARVIAGLPPGRYWHTEPAGNAAVIKRHLKLWPGDLETIEKGVFIFGDIIKAVLSTRRARLDKRHLENCLCQKTMDEIDILRCDDLNYEQIFDFWAGSNSNGNMIPVQQFAFKFPLLLLRYEKIWKYTEEIEDFSCQKLVFPPMRIRVTKPENFPTGDVRAIKKTYKSLIAKIAKMPDIELIGPES